MATREHAAYENASCGLLTMDAKGTIEIANPVIAALTGFARDLLVGRRFQDLFSVGSQLFLQTHWWPLLQLQGSVAEVHLELVTPDRVAIPTLVNALQRADKRVDVSVFVATDRRKYEHELLLARRSAEELVLAVRVREQQFRTLAENSPDTILRFDADRRITYVSRAIDPFTGGPSEALTGKTAEALMLPLPIAHGLARGLDDALAGRAGVCSFERASDEKLLELETAFVPERGVGDHVISVLVVVRDLTVLKQQAREARQRAAVAEQLIGIVSHDLRNPLSAILLGAGILANVDRGHHAATVQRIVNSAKRATRLTDDLLDFAQARLGAGLRVDPVAIDLHAAVADTVEELRLAWAGRSIEHRRIGSGTAHADPDRLAQVVTNLVSNAMVYGTPNTPVDVTSVVGESTIELRVHNQGPPISPELVGQIFEPLRRGQEQVQRGSRSVGLGLYIVREIVQAHRGRASVDSTEERGTTFIVTWPRHPIAEPSP